MIIDIIAVFISIAIAAILSEIAISNDKICQASVYEPDLEISKWLQDSDEETDQ